MRGIVTMLIITLLVGCERRPIVDEVCTGYDGEGVASSVLVPVKVDWSESRITPSTNSYDDDYVHRVSLRFFPTDGSSAFERYLEGNIYDGYVWVPEGEYSVVAYNESIDDPYWEGVFDFVDVDDYDNFMAVLADEDEEYSTQAYKLASWSLDYYEVSDDTKSGDSELEQIKLMPLTCYVNITATVTNLSSAQSLYCDVSGFSDRVYMASGESHPTATVHRMELISREYSDDENKHGTTSHERLILEKSTDEESSLVLKFEILLADGTWHDPDEALEFDVSHQTTRYATDDYDLSAEFELPEISTGIDVDVWVDEEVITIF